MKTAFQVGEGKTTKAPAISRAGYRLIADALGWVLADARLNDESNESRRDEGEESGVDGAIGALIIALQRDNQRFDERKFRAAINKTAKHAEEKMVEEAESE